MKFKEFRSVVKNYKVVFFDAFGVLKNYNGAIPTIEKTFEYLRKRNIDFYVLTNDASRSPLQLAESYNKIGIDVITPDKIISSGMLAREYLRLKVPDGTVAYLGTPNSAHYLEALGLKTLPIHKVDLDDVEHVNALVLLDDEGFDWNNDINKTINLLRRRNIPVIVANTDSVYPVSTKDVAIAIGGIGDMIEEIVSKNFIRFGKPDAQMFHYAYEHVCKTHEVQKNEILMVGDTLDTDIMGGNKFGLDTALVLTGNTLRDNAKHKIRTSGIIPTYICNSATV
jgi:HAD superfamily hydrolase (TIGR01450 family)